VSITDLTNTTWIVPAGWSAKHNYGIFSVDYNYEYGTTSGSQTTLRIGFDNGSGDNGDNIIGFGTKSIYPATAFTITITGGVDATNSALISWLETYSEKPTPTDAVIVEYNNAVIATLTEGKVTLSCKDKQMHTNVVITVPEFGGEEILEWDGSYTIGGGVELISFTIEGVNYQAEDGMTWAEWIESEYNTGSITTDGGSIVILATSSTTGYMIESTNGTVYTYNVIVVDTAYTKGRRYDFGS
jgi:hypothetical protein